MNEKKDNVVNVSKKDIWRTFWRSKFLMISQNYERMQALGAYFTVAPFLEKLYKDKPKEQKVAAIKRHLEFFNTNPYVYGPIAGITLATEQSTDESSKASVTSIKTGLMGPLAGLGDSLLALTFYPILASICAGIAMEGNVAGTILLFVIFNAVILPIEYFGVKIGYSKGVEIFSSDKGQSLLNRVSTIANVVGMMVIGALIVSIVNVHVPISVGTGDNVMLVQEMLDTIMPNLLPLAITLLSFVLLKKGQGKNAAFIIIGIIVVSVILSMIGVLG